MLVELQIEAPSLRPKTKDYRDITLAYEDNGDWTKLFTREILLQPLRMRRDYNLSMVFRVVDTITKVDNKPREEQYDIKI